jgi:hypothetical protein
VSDLLLDLDTTDFKTLIEIGRSMIPTIAPGWTDHNIHDPGIMLMELIAWIADAQVYALAHVSRGERTAYGRLLGLELTGPRPATGLIWPFATGTAASAPIPWAAGTVIDVPASVTGDRPKAPLFYPTRKIELTTAVLTALVTTFADGTTRDWTRANTQQGATFQPFGPNPQKGDRLALTLGGALIGSPASGAPISIGVEIIPDAASANPASNDSTGWSPVRLRVTLEDTSGPWSIAVAQDTTGGFSHSGVLLLTVDPGLAGRTGPFTLIIESETGSFLLPPRVQCIALNVLPVQQIQAVVEAVNSYGRGTPDQTYPLKIQGLIWPEAGNSFSVQVSDGTAMQPWTSTDDLSAADPSATVYSFDPQAMLVTFGNGINGRMPQAGADLLVEYLVTAGSSGNLPRDIQWTVRGVEGPFGSNTEVTSGGSDALDLNGLRTQARTQVRDARPIVTTGDLQNAALAFSDLDVRRALELPVATGAPRVSGARVLLAVGPHETSSGTDTFTESSLWLGEVRRRLVPRLPLGQSLDVIGPRLIDVGIVAHVAVAPQLSIADVSDAIAAMLAAKLAITTTIVGSPVWPFDRDLTLLTVKGWLRNVDGVVNVIDVSLRSTNRSATGDRISLGPIELPRLQIASGDITVDRAPVGGAA